MNVSKIALCHLWCIPQYISWFSFHQRANDYHWLNFNTHILKQLTLKTTSAPTPQSCLVRKCRWIWHRYFFFLLVFFFYFLFFKLFFLQSWPKPLQGHPLTVTHSTPLSHIFKRMSPSHHPTFCGPKSLEIYHTTVLYHMCWEFISSWVCCLVVCSVSETSQGSRLNDTAGIHIGPLCRFFEVFS